MADVRHLGFCHKSPIHPDGQLKIFGSIASTEDDSALKAGPVAGPSNSGNSGCVNLLVYSVASRDYFNDALILGLRYNLTNYQVVDPPRKIITAGEHQLNGITQELLQGNVIDGGGAQSLGRLSYLVLPGLGRNIFSVKLAAHNGVVSIFNMDNPRLDAKQSPFRSERWRATSTPLALVM